MHSLKEFLTQEDLDNYIKNLHDYNNNETSQAFFNAIDKFLTKNKLKKPFLNHKNYKTNLGYEWDNYINGKLQKSEIHKFFNQFFYKIVVRNHSMNNDDVEKTYNQIITTFDSGNFNKYELPEMYDFQTGKTFNVDFENWTPRLLQFIPGPDWRSGSFIVAPEIEVQNYVEKEIEFKTGNLLVADWFRIPEFTALVDKDKLQFDVNSEEGRLNQTLHYLNNFNFISNASFYNSSILQKNDDYIFAYYNDEHKLPSGYQDKGSVSKSLRAISIIEKEHLEELVGKQTVEDFFYKEIIFQLRVNPGTYKVCLSSGPEHLEANWSNIGLEDDTNTLSDFVKKDYITPALVLKGINIKLENNNSKSKKIKI